MSGGCAVHSNLPGCRPTRINVLVLCGQLLERPPVRATVGRGGIRCSRPGPTVGHNTQPAPDHTATADAKNRTSSKVSEKIENITSCDGQENSAGVAGEGAESGESGLTNLERVSALLPRLDDFNGLARELGVRRRPRVFTYIYIW